MPNRQPELRLVGGGGEPPTRGRRPFRPHPLADLLWTAIYPSPAKSYEQIVERMNANPQRNSRRVTFYQMNNCLHHVRTHQEPGQYDWSVTYAQKGALGEDRAYFPVVENAEDAPRALGHNRLINVTQGLVSYARTARTMALVEGRAVEMFADTADITATEKRKLKAAVAMFSAAAEIAEQVLSRVSTAA